MIKIGNYEYSEQVAIELEIEKLINEGLGGGIGVYVHLNGTIGKILIRIYGIKIKEQLIYNRELLEELGTKGFANMVVLDVTFS